VQTFSQLTDFAYRRGRLNRHNTTVETLEEADLIEETNASMEFEEQEIESPELKVCCVF
jgi:hypothetical protein